VTQPVYGDNNLWKLIDQLRATRTPENLGALLQEIRDRLGVGATVPFLAREMRAGHWRYLIVPATVTAERTFLFPALGLSVLAAESTVTADAQTTKSTGKPTLLEWFNALPCGQQLGVCTILILVAVLAFDVSTEARDYIASMLAVIGVAYSVIRKITKS
jgi:hypothetical protein